jgi:predicted aspartyl protease
MKKLLLVLILLVPPWVLADSEQQWIPMQTYGSSTYYIDSEILGAGQYSMLVDTGSAYSVINEETLARLSSKGQAHFVKKLLGKMADGSKKVIPLYRIAAINLGGNCLIEDIHAAILPGKTRQIIGISTLMRAAPFAMSFDPPMLSLSQCASSMQQASLDVESTSQVNNSSQQ